ncbi:MAG: T9SS type A sorting domain-containing protein [Ignavibacteria bacterium]|nr:T9SS type A sorting domain-containing protein [Ignavibacteria bacterium]
MCGGNGCIVKYDNRISSIINNSEENTSSGFTLLQNYPNPFNPSTNIRYNLNSDSYIILKVFDILGKEIKTLVHQKQSKGKYEIRFDAENLPGGIYFYKIESEFNSETGRMLLIK